jgi:hypothetical protein
MSPQTSAIAGQSDFFLGLVTAVLRNQAGQAARMLDDYMTSASDRCVAMARVGYLAPWMVAGFARDLSCAVPAAVLPPSGRVVAEEAALLDAARACMADDVGGATRAVAGLHDVGGCESIRLMILIAVYLCADLEMRRMARAGR